MKTTKLGGALALIAIAVAAAAPGCDGGEEAAEPEAPIVPDKDAIHKETQNGPVKATVLVWPAKPQLADPIYVRLTVDAEPGVAVDLPFQTGQLGESALGRFRVIDFAGDKRRSDKGHQIEEHTYVLQAQSSGRHRIPPFRLEMQDRRGAAAGSAASAAPAEASTEVLTEEIPVEIAEIPVEKVTASLAPVRGELAVNPGARAWWWWAALAGIAVAWLAMAVALWRRWRQRQAIARRRSAYDEAVTELRQLESAGAPTVDTADAWFVRLSAIVRRYLEKRYEIRAPELTTEEFLQVALHGVSLTAQHRALLGTFLQCCDRVKFAAYRPEEKESLEMLAAARSFVEDTRLREGELDDKGGARAA